MSWSLPETFLLLTSKVCPYVTLMLQEGIVFTFLLQVIIHFTLWSRRNMNFSTILTGEGSWRASQQICWEEKKHFWIKKVIEQSSFYPLPNCMFYVDLPFKLWNDAWDSPSLTWVSTGKWLSYMSCEAHICHHLYCCQNWALRIYKFYRTTICLHKLSKSWICSCEIAIIAILFMFVVMFFAVFFVYWLRQYTISIFGKVYTWPGFCVIVGYCSRKTEKL